MSRNCHELYMACVLAADPEAAVASMTDRELRALHAKLAESDVQTGVPKLVRGLVEASAAERFLIQQDANEP